MTRPILLPVPNAPSDAELVARAVEGDRFGRELIYRRHAAYLLTMVTRLVSSRAAAEAIARETFVLAWKRLPELAATTAPADRSLDLRLWLSRIAVGLARRRLRRARLLRFIGLGSDRDDGDHDATLAALAAVDLRHEARQDLEHVDHVLDLAGVEPRIAWMLRRVDGLPLDEVASACACSPAAAQRRIAEVDARLCERFGTPAESP